MASPAWQALRAVYAGADSTRSGLISALDALKALKVPQADNFAQTADKVSVQMALIQNNALIQNISATELLALTRIHLATVMQILSAKPLCVNLITALRTDDDLVVETSRARRYSETTASRLVTRTPSQCCAPRSRSRRSC